MQELLYLVPCSDDVNVVNMNVKYCGVCKIALWYCNIVSATVFGAPKRLCLCVCL